MSERGPAGSWQHLAYWHADGTMDLGATQRLLPVDDKAAGELLRDEFPNRIWYLERDDAWLIYDGQCHRPDSVSNHSIGAEIAGFSDRLRYAVSQAKTQVHAAADAVTAGQTEAAQERARVTAWEQWKTAEKYAAGLARNAGRAAMAGYMASSLCRAVPSMFGENHDYELSVADGMLDLRTGYVRPHSPADMVTYALRTRWNPEAEAPEFWRVLCGATEDYATACFLLEVLGYSLLGYNPDQCIIFWRGDTGSGKSVILRVVSEILEDLAHAAQVQLVTYTPHGRNARVENSIRGKRLVTVTETSARMHLEEAQLKKLTGEATMEVDQHYHKTTITTRITWLIIVTTNVMPTSTSFDAAMRRRAIVVPGGESLPVEQMDPRLAERILSREKEGILKLLVRGCQQYLRDGRLLKPEAVVRATNEYVLSQDTVAAFLAECCELMSGSSVAAAKVWEAYRIWSEGSPRLGRNEFYAALGLPGRGVAYSPKQRKFDGIRLSADWSYRTS